MARYLTKRRDGGYTVRWYGPQGFRVARTGFRRRRDALAFKKRQERLAWGVAKSSDEVLQ